MAWASKTFDPQASEPFRLSRSKLDLYTDCPRCAYLDLRLGVKRVSGPSFTLNNAVDELLKREFDIHRARGTTHPLLKAYGVDAVPYDDPRMEEWRDALRRGISTHHQESNLILRGGVDDIWITPQKELIVVDYKATSKKEGPSTTDDLYDAYKKQVEIYQWLFRKNGFTVSPTAYFVYVNGKSDLEAFDGKLEFDIKLIGYVGNDSWVAGALMGLKAMLMSDEIPKVGIAFGGGPCDFCTYREAAGKALAAQHVRSKAPVKKVEPKKKDEPTASMF
ncbi:MAG: PD-(D/E)XK nuclease family protein [Candidatus Pacebacteria bacterium]|nr:PD-(D/E)XK nuclease family protein [Candidatus Paceibacterota bacterium]